ncbi:MAG TPA: redoxin domain-containing protein [Acidobacteriota bacterium]|nr:redoxin domain-containing protein [Acidobacteriota bacterium]
MPTQKTQEIGGGVEDFSLRSISGGEQSLSAFLKGRKGGIVLFWSGVCSHCVRYDAYLSSFSERHPELALVAVASRQGETREQIQKTAGERHLSFPILHDPDGAIARRWFTQQTPRAFLLDADLTLLYRGAIDNFKFPDDPAYVAYLEPAIHDFLQGQPVRRSETASFGCAIQSVYYILPNPL